LFPCTCVCLIFRFGIYSTSTFLDRGSVAIIPRQDAVTIAELYAQNAVFNTPEGTFHGRQAIEELYAKHYFGEAHSKNVVTVVSEALLKATPELQEMVIMR
jgi:hypothetical protein